jgi:NitT/TauT family transport system ATP-binding protein
MNTTNTDIKVTNLSIKFQKNSKSKSFFALDSVNFEVKRGEFFCIVGPSGCGKSTLLKTLLGFLQPTTGEVYISEERKKAGMVYLPQSPSLLPWRTLLQNAALGLEIKGKLDKDRKDILKFEIDKFGLGDFEKHLSTEISGGMKQKVELIRALASGPQLLFCDEPFASIDFVNRFELNTEFKYRRTIAKTTTVFVTHNIEEAIFLGNKIAVMSQRPGQIMKIYEPKLSKNAQDAVKCRESPEFEDLFQEIWENLKGNYE